METDKPIQSPLDDELEQKSFAFYLAKGILGLKDSKDSFVMGVCAKWGDGKTSTINMALAYLRCLYKKEKLGTYVDADKILEPPASIVKKYDTSFWINLITISVLSVFLFFNHFIFDYNLFTFRFWGDILKINPFVLMLIIVGMLYILLHKFISKVYDWIFGKKDSDFVTIYFNPWNYTDAKEMLAAFFRAISKELAKDDSNCLNHASKLIKEYAKIAHSIDLSAIEKIFMNKSEQDIKDKIDESLKDCNKKIIVIVDDLDRLIPEEILLMFKTVKIIADFPNMIYLLAYDKENIEKQFEKSESGIDIQDYIKKIVQVEKNLPLIDPEFLKTKFMLDVSNIKVHNPEYKNVELIEKMYDLAIKDKYIKNYRDLKRFFNTFEFIYSAYKDEDINIQDLIGITAIEVFEPQLYIYIRDNWDVLINKGIILDEEDKYIFKYNYQEKYDIEKFIRGFADKNLSIVSALFPDFLSKLKYNIGKMKKGDILYKEFYAFSEQIPDVKEFITKNETHISIGYRRINNEIFFKNYFKTNLEKSLLSKKEQDGLFNNLNDPNIFKQNLNKIFENNHYKLIDLFKSWNSVYNEKNRTRDNIISLLDIFLSLDNTNIINFINDNDNIFYVIARNIVYDFNKENLNNKISVLDRLNLIKDNINNINSNIYFFVYFACWIFRYPSDNTPVLTAEEEGLYAECKKLFSEQIDSSLVIQSEQACQIMALLLEYFDGSEKISHFCEHLLLPDNEERLLKVICTSKGAYCFELEGLNVFIEIFKHVGKINPLKLKMFELYENSDYSKLIHRKEFRYFDDDGDEYENIVEEVLKSILPMYEYIGDVVVFNMIDNHDKDESILRILEQYYGGNISQKDLSFIKEKSHSGKIQSLNRNLKVIKEYAQKSNLELYKKYENLISKLLDDSDDK